jgi:RNA polymerase sigma factor (sigma-70 family)
MISNEELEKEIESLAWECGHALRQHLRGGKILLPEHLVGEVINDALLVVVDKRRRGHTLTNPRAYLFRVARNAAIDRLTSLYAVEVPDSPAVEWMRGQTGMLAEAQVSEGLRLAIEQLPTRQRQVIELRYLRDFSVAETAEILGMAEGTVGPTTTSAVRKLKQFFTERGGTWEEET